MAIGAGRVELVVSATGEDKLSATLKGVNSGLEKSAQVTGKYQKAAEGVTQVDKLRLERAIALQRGETSLVIQLERHIAISKIKERQTRGEITADRAALEITIARTEAERQLALAKARSGASGIMGEAKTKVGNALGALGTLGGIGMAAAAAGLALKEMWNAAGEGAKGNDQLAILRRNVQGIDGIIADAAKAMGGMVSDAKIQQSAASFASFGLDMSQFSKAAEQAAKTAVRLGTDSGHLMESLVTGVSRESAMLLDNLGIQVSITKAKEDYARSIGKTADQLSAAEGKAAVLASTLQKLEEANKNVNFSDSQAAAIERVNTAWENGVNAAKGWLAEGLVAPSRAVESLEKQTKALQAQIDAKRLAMFQATEEGKRWTAAIGEGLQAWARWSREAKERSAEAQKTLTEGTRAVESWAQAWTLVGPAIRAAAVEAEKWKEASKLTTEDTIRLMTSTLALNAKATREERQAVAYKAHGLRLTQINLDLANKRITQELYSVKVQQLQVDLAKELAGIEAALKKKGGGQKAEGDLVASNLRLKKAELEAAADLTLHRQRMVATIGHEIRLAEIQDDLGKKKITADRAAYETRLADLSLAKDLAGIEAQKAKRQADLSKKIQDERKAELTALRAIQEHEAKIAKIRQDSQVEAQVAALARGFDGIAAGGALIADAWGSALNSVGGAANSIYEAMTAQDALTAATHRQVAAQQALQAALRDTATTEAQKAALTKEAQDAEVGAVQASVAAEQSRTQALMAGIGAAGELAQAFIEGEREKAGISALTEGALSVASFASGNIPGGIGHGIAAAQFGLIAGGVIKTSAQVSKEDAARKKAKDEAEKAKREAEAKARGAGSSGSNGAITINLNNGLSTRQDVAWAIRQAQASAYGTGHVGARV